MQIESLPISTLVFDPANVRTHDNKNLEAIKGSLARFGQQKPIVVNEAGVVVAGNGTLAAARALGWTQINTVKTGLEGSDAVAYAIADNRSADLAEWDDGALSQILSALQIEDEALLASTGFSAGELAALVDDVAGVDLDPPEGPPPMDAADDDLPEAPPAITQPGEIIRLGRHTLIAGECIELMKAIPENSIDSICTDPPYGIGFMGSKWDCTVPGEDFAREAFRVLKPGGHLIAFAATRTVHRLTVALEDSGFEIRDLIGWLQWQGFPKSRDVSKAIDSEAGAVREVVGTYAGATNIGKKAEGKMGYAPGTSYPKVDTTVYQTAPATDDAKKWEGWGTALKPAQEPAVLCRKPLEGTVAENVLKWGTGGINIDGCRIAYGDPAWPGPGNVLDYDENDSEEIAPQGRAQRARGMYRPASSEIGRWPANIYHCTKPSRGEREEGCEELPSKTREDVTGRKAGSAGQQHARSGMTRTGEIGNHHPTVKPVALMRWLVRMITPPGGRVLEPFAGSGTTLIAAEREAVDCLGFEREPAYCDIIRARVEKAIDEG